jgi:hypothetical protein
VLEATKLVVEQGKRQVDVLRLYPGIPKSTLFDAVKRARGNQNILPAVGSPPKMSYNDNQQLFDWCLESAKRALHQTKASILSAAMKMANRRGVKFDTDSGLPSQSWWLRFCAQFPQMKLFRAQLLSRGQAHAADSVTLNRFYQLISNVIITTGVSPGQIWAADETVGTAFFIDFALLAGLRFFLLQMFGKVSERGKVFGPVDQANPKVLSADKYSSHMTCLPAISAAGELSTPLFILEVEWHVRISV